VKHLGWEQIAAITTDLEGPDARGYAIADMRPFRNARRVREAFEETVLHLSILDTAQVIEVKKRLVPIWERIAPRLVD
jgi:hypothetical protein